MGSVIVPNIPIRCNVAQQIKGRRFLNAYLCPRCGTEIYRTAWKAKRYTFCLSCRRSKHGGTTKNAKSPIYSVWRGILSRCKDPASHRYKDYGGRGISVCEEWGEFELFQEWANLHGWKRGLQIDRIDNDQGYCPQNCRLVTPKENMRNSRRAKLSPQDVRCIRMLRWSGIPSRDVARIFSVNRETVNSIMRLHRWSDV